MVRTSVISQPVDDDDDDDKNGDNDDEGFEVGPNALTFIEKNTLCNVFLNVLKSSLCLVISISSFTST